MDKNSLQAARSTNSLMSYGKRVVMKSYQNYERTIHADVEESLSKIVDKISPNSVVLDVGCGPGMLGSYLSEVKGCIVDGVDSDETAIEICRSRYRFTAVKNLESESLTSVFQPETYDYIIVADVLEHLANPDQLLSGLKKLVKPDGTIIFSVPNITHVAVGFELLFGYFEYSQNGLFDNTHLRFYSRQSLLDKLQAFGLYAWEVDTVQKEIAETEFSNHISKLFPAQWTNALVANREDALTYQWLLSTKIYPNDNQKIIKPESLCIRNPSLLFATELYWTDRESPFISESNKLVGRLISRNEDLTIIDFHFSECGGINGLQQIRIDPVSEPKHFLIANAEILTGEGKVVWRGQPQVDDGQVHGARLIVFVDSVGCLFQSTNNDPQWLPSIDKKILDQVTKGWIFRLTLKSDEALFSIGYKKLIDQSQSYESTLIERDREMAVLQQRQNELQVLYSELLNENIAYRLSTSWRITKPLRKISQSGQQFMRLVRICQNYRQRYPGFAGFQRLAFRCVDAIRNGGVKGLRDRIFLQERIAPRVPMSEEAVAQKFGAHQIDFLQTHLEKDLILYPTIIFDHNGGGGSNIYTNELVKVIHADGGAVLRVYCFDAVWFVQWITDDGVALFHTSSIEKLFHVLSASRSASIVINSLYGYPDIKEAASSIDGLARLLNATLDFKIHDFYALCPSPHLSDFEEKYCDVPQDPEVCKNCLKKNLSWYHPWYPAENRPIDINEWRKPFVMLLNAATTVTFFDQSSVEIVRKAFHLEECKIKVVPHVINYFKCDRPIDIGGTLHIGILGTLSHIKGGNLVRALYEYIDGRGLKIPVTVVGDSFVATPPGINVHGSYVASDLPEIVGERGINVILMPSIVPETFSYTISEAMKMELPIVAFDIGAQGNRVKQYKFGKVIPLGSSPELILSTIQSALVAAQEFRK